MAARAHPGTARSLPVISIRGAGIFTPFPDTEVFRLAVERGLIDDEEQYCDDLGRVYEFPYVNLTNYFDSQLIAWRDEIDQLSMKSNAVADVGFDVAV